MHPLPHKLINDAIAEAIFEIRFESSESQALPEVVVGKLAEPSRWPGYEPVRLPLADFPPAARANSPDLKFQPIVELRNSGIQRIAKIGPNSISYHVLAPYPGWAEFDAEIGKVIDGVFHNFNNFTVSRLGLRYVNLLNPTEHGISDISALNLSVHVDGKRLDVPQMLMFERTSGTDFVAQVRIASPKFVQSAPSPFVALVDVDVATAPDSRVARAKDAKKWVQEAHEFEKRQFFELLKPETIEALRMDHD